MDEATARAGEGVTRGFLFADLRGYTQLVEARGAIRAKHALERYRTLTRAVVSRHGGAEVRTEGDSFYVVLPSASAAVRCGLDLVATALLPPDGEGPITVGVGIHAGETIPYAGDYVGSAVNIAARICAAARPNELLASGTVRELTRSIVSARFLPAGRRALKGITGTVDLFRVVPDATESARTGAAHRVPSARGRWPWVAAGGLLLALGTAAGFAAWTQTVAPSAGASEAPTGPQQRPSPSSLLPFRGAGSLDRPPEVPPGEYAPNLNQDVASLTIDEAGWHLLADQADVLAVELGSPQPVSGSLGVSRIPIVFSGGCPDDPAVLLGDRPDDLIAWATSNPHLQVSAPMVALNLGLPGVAIEATVLPLPSNGCPGGNPERIRLWQQGGLDVALLAGSRIRLEALDGGNETLAIAVISEDPAHFQGFQAHAQRVLDEMTLRGG
ncbi:MAG: adenylate/guanylate cyclase domain-containing protein [Chloroflexi bacterium]|nr:adenylate/guanylate cyclase domain-containing protein [Chloroflexota bacterium]